MSSPFELTQSLSILQMDKAARKVSFDKLPCPFVHRTHGLRLDRGVDRRRPAADHRTMAEYALVTALVATLAISLSAIPESQLAARLPTTAAKAQALVTQTARDHRVPTSEARAALARAPYRRAPLRYLFASAGSTAATTLPRASSRVPLRARRRGASRRRSAATHVSSPGSAG
jgi:hypothetical protein